MPGGAANTGCFIACVSAGRKCVRVACCARHCNPAGVCMLLMCRPAVAAGAVPGRRAVSCVQQQGGRIISQGEPAAAKACTLDSCCSGARGGVWCCWSVACVVGLCAWQQPLREYVVWPAALHRLLPIATLVFVHVASSSACTYYLYAADRLLFTHMQATFEQQQHLRASCVCMMHPSDVWMVVHALQACRTAARVWPLLASRAHQQSAGNNSQPVSAHRCQ